MCDPLARVLKYFHSHMNPSLPPAALLPQSEILQDVREDAEFRAGEAASPSMSPSETLRRSLCFVLEEAVAAARERHGSTRASEKLRHSDSGSPHGSHLLDRSRSASASEPSGPAPLAQATSRWNQRPVRKYARSFTLT
jgi:hypothetical protein